VFCPGEKWGESYKTKEGGGEGKNKIKNEISDIA